MTTFFPVLSQEFNDENLLDRTVCLSGFFSSIADYSTPVKKPSAPMISSSMELTKFSTSNAEIRKNKKKVLYPQRGLFATGKTGSPSSMSATGREFGQMKLDKIYQVNCPPPYPSLELGFLQLATRGKYLYSTSKMLQPV